MIKFTYAKLLGVLIINYTSLYSNPTANKEVWGALLYTNPTDNKEIGKSVLYQNPVEIKK